MTITTALCAKCYSPHLPNQLCTSSIYTKRRITPVKLYDNLACFTESEIPDVCVNSVRQLCKCYLPKLRWSFRCHSRVYSGQDDDIRTFPKHIWSSCSIR